MNHSSSEPVITEPAIQAMLDRQTQAWNKGDGQTWAEAFTDDADFVNIRGDVFHGRAEIAQRHANILAGPFKGSHAVVTIRRLTLLSPDAAVIETVHEVTGFPKLMPGISATAEGVLRTRMKYVALKKDGQWHFVAAQNTAILPPSPMPPK